jgi:PHS family inorganic phosphate transporter-like MFS transporter
VGNVLVPLVGLLILKIFGTPDDREGEGSGMPGISWRLLLGIGALPGLLLAPFKTTPSTAPTAQPAAGAQMSLWQAVRSPRYMKKLVGTAGGWFIFDITFYGNTLFAPTVLRQIFHTGDSTPLDGPTVKENLCYQLLIIALIGLPGYYVSVFLMDKLGRKLIQLQGFLFMAVLYGILAIWLDDLGSGLLIVIYGLTYFFSNFGPNTTTFILPSESFPYEVRSTLNGFSAACGKAGAVLGAAAFQPIASAGGNGAAMAVCSVCALLGFILTMFFVEDRRGKGMAGNSIVVAAPSEEALK